MAWRLKRRTTKRDTSPTVEFAAGVKPVGALSRMIHKHSAVAANPGIPFVSLASPSRHDACPPLRSKQFLPLLCSGYHSAPRSEYLESLGLGPQGPRIYKVHKLLRHESTQHGARFSQLMNFTVSFVSLWSVLASSDGF